MALITTMGGTVELVYRTAATFLSLGSYFER